jgi:hypothetical protein
MWIYEFAASHGIAVRRRRNPDAVAPHVPQTGSQLGQVRIPVLRLALIPTIPPEGLQHHLTIPWLAPQRLQGENPDGDAHQQNDHDRSFRDGLLGRWLIACLAPAVLLSIIIGWILQIVEQLKELRSRYEFAIGDLLFPEGLPPAMDELALALAPLFAQHTF